MTPLEQSSPESASTLRLIERPIIIVGPPRSGSSMLLAALSAHPDLWSIYRESSAILEGPFHPARRGWESHVLTEEDLDEQTAGPLLRQFYEQAGNLEKTLAGRLIPLRGRGRFSDRIARISRPFKRPPIRIVEKTPTNVFRVRFLQALFPDAYFLHLVRGPEATIASLYQGWLDPVRHNDYPLPHGFRIRGYSGSSWSFVFPPGWQSYDGMTLAEVCAHQWTASHASCLRDLGHVDPQRVLRVHYENLIQSPMALLRSIASWAGVDTRPFDHVRRLPLVNAHTQPGSDKWRALENEIMPTLPITAEIAKRLGYA